MTDRDLKIIKKLGLNEEDFKPKEVKVSTEERINDLEIAICEILESMAE